MLPVATLVPSYTLLSADAVSTNGLGVTVKVPSLTVVTDKPDNTVPPEIVIAAEPTSALAADNVELKVGFTEYRSDNS